MQSISNNHNSCKQNFLVAKKTDLWEEKPPGLEIPPACSEPQVSSEIVHRAAFQLRAARELVLQLSLLHVLGCKPSKPGRLLIFLSLESLRHVFCSLKRSSRTTCWDTGRETWGAASNGSMLWTGARGFPKVIAKHINCCAKQHIILCSLSV